LATILTSGGNSTISTLDRLNHVITRAAFLADLQAANSIPLTAAAATAVMPS